MPKTDAEIYAEDNEATLLALVELQLATFAEAQETFDLLSRRRETYLKMSPLERSLTALSALRVDPQLSTPTLYPSDP